VQDWMLYAPSGEDCAQGTAHAPNGALDGLGCPGLDRGLPDRVRASDTPKRFALPRAVEFRGDVRVREHDSSP
jgi:hypothetical protein